MLIVQTPLRVSLFGGGTDFPSYYEEHGGCVLSSAINKYVFITIKRRFDDKIVVGYTRTESVDRVDEIQHDLIREVLRLSGISRGVEIATMADIPSRGSGLGSSSSITVGALHAASAYRGELVSAAQLALGACTIERDILGAPIGVQDQYIAAYGGLRFINFCQNGGIEIQHTPISAETQTTLSRNLMLFFTGIDRQAGSILAEQKANIHTRLAILDEMKSIARTAYQSLIRGDVEQVGTLLNESWQLKKRLASRISNPAINDMYDTARKAGASGGKISGAGGGGFMMLYCPIDRQQAVRSALSHLRELPFQFDPYGSQVIFSKPSERLFSAENM